jgi:hypothetical protein
VSRKPPDTRLRRRYERIGAVGFNTAERQRECDDLVKDVSPLVEEFLDSVRVFCCYDNCAEDFYPRDGKRRPLRNSGTHSVIKKLQAGPVHVDGLADYTFQYRDRELDPRRATNAGARHTGTGGLDYIAIVEGDPDVPVLGEIKKNSDKDAYYAFIQLLMYLSELVSEAQTKRANAFLFHGCVPSPPCYDLHILLADFNNRGGKGRLIPRTHRLAVAFKDQLGRDTNGAHPVGRVLCLSMTEATFNDSLQLCWAT